MLYPNDKREIDRLLDGFWHDVFSRFDDESSEINVETSGHIAASCEKIAREALEEYFNV